MKALKCQLLVVISILMALMMLWSGVFIAVLPVLTKRAVLKAMEEKPDPGMHIVQYMEDVQDVVVMWGTEKYLNKYGEIVIHGKWLMRVYKKMILRQVIKNHTHGYGSLDLQIRTNPDPNMHVGWGTGKNPGPYIHVEWGMGENPDPGELYSRPEMHVVWHKVSKGSPYPGPDRPQRKLLKGMIDNWPQGSMGGAHLDCNRGELCTKCAFDKVVGIAL